MPNVSCRKLTCNNFAAPKCIFVTWLAILNRMVTCDNMQKIGIQCSMQCCLCSTGIETVSHFFFECEYSAAVWGVVLQWLGISRRPQKWEDELMIVVSQFRSNSGMQQIYRMALSTSVYLLWKERNSIFSN